MGVMRNIIVAVFVSLLIFACSLPPRMQIRVVGSSTVYPFIALAAEQFARATDYPTPIVEATGTGGGMKLFCGGVGQKHPDIVNLYNERFLNKFINPFSNQLANFYFEFFSFILFYCVFILLYLICILLLHN